MNTKTLVPSSSPTPTRRVKHARPRLEVQPIESAPRGWFKVVLVAAAIAALFYFTLAPAHATDYRLNVEYGRRVQDAPVPPALHDWSSSVFFDIKSNKSAAVVGTNLTRLNDLFGMKGFWLDLDAFAGLTLDQNGSALAGFSVGRTFKVDRDGKVKFKLAAAVTQGRTIGYGVIAGLEVHF